MAQSQNEIGSKKLRMTEKLATFAKDNTPAINKDGIEQYNRNDMEESLRDEIEKHIGTAHWYLLRVSEYTKLFNSTRPTRISLVSGTATILEVHMEVLQPVDIEKGKENCATIKHSNSLVILGFPAPET